MKKGITLVLIPACFLLLSRCYPHLPEDIDDIGVVTTHNQSYNFAGKATYAMPDRMVEMTGFAPEDEEPGFIPDATAMKLLTAIANNMEDLGWQRVDVGNDPDLLLLPAVLGYPAYVWYYYDHFYDWWYDDYYPSWYRTWDPLWGVSFVHTIMVIIDPDKVTVDQEGKLAPDMQWVGAVFGIPFGGFNTDRVIIAINRVFAISPYLKTN